MVQKAEELAYMLGHCRAKGIVTQREFLKRLTDLETQMTTMEMDLARGDGDRIGRADDGVRHRDGRDHPRLGAGSVHGTGCYLSSAVLAFLAEGRAVAEACGLAIERIVAAIRDAVPAGGGRRVFDLSRERGRARTGPRKPR